MLWDISGMVQRHGIPLLFAVLFSMAVFILPPVMPLIDSAGYMDITKNLYLGRGFLGCGELDKITSPGLPFMAAAFMHVFGPGILYIKALTAFIGFLMFLGMYFLAYEITGRKDLSLLSSALLVVIAEVLFMTLQTLSDAPFLALLVISAGFYVRLLKHERLADAGLFGIFIGFAWLTRTVAAIFLVAALAYLVVKKPRDFSLIKTVFVIMFMAGIVLVPWLMYANSIGIDPFGPHLQGLAPGGGLSAEIDITRFFGGRLLVPLLGERITMPLQMLSITKMTGSALLYIGPIALLVMLVALYRWAKRRASSPFTGLLFIWILIFLLFFMAFSHLDFSARYILVFIPPVMILFSIWAGESWERRKKVVVLVLALHFLFSFAVMAYDSGNRWANANTMVHYQAGNWIKANTAEDRLYEIGSGSGAAMCYYADRITESLGDPVNESLMLEIKDKNPSTLMITNIMKRSFDEQQLISVLGYELCAEFDDGRFFARIYKERC